MFCKLFCHEQDEAFLQLLCHEQDETVLQLPSALHKLIHALADKAENPSDPSTLFY